MKSNFKSGLVLLIFSAFAFVSCEKNSSESDPYFDNAYECQKNSANRIGARCKDGSKSKATGSGACSRHGGVEVWLCK